MSEERCTPRMTSICDENELAAATEKGACPAWSFCLPFGGELMQRDGCVEYVEGTPPPDGVYDKIVIVNGCIVGLEKDGIPWYTASPCAPVPDDCSGEGGIGTPSTIACNLLQYDAAGRPYVCVTIQGGTGIDVVGTGTAQDPIIVTNTAGGGGGSGGYVQSGNSGITVTGTGERVDPYKVGHALANNAPQTAVGLSLDRYGHVVGYTPSDSHGIQAVQGGEGIHTENDPAKGIATVSLEDVAELTPGTYRVGNYDLTIDSKGRVVKITRVWTVPSRVFRVNCVDYTVNEDGLISNIYDVPLEECSSGYTALKSHLVRFITPASWGSSDYLANGNTPTGNADVVTFEGYGTDNQPLTEEWDEIYPEYSPPASATEYYDINFFMAEASALFFRFTGSGEWSTQGNCEHSCEILHTLTHWVIDLDGVRVLDRKGNCIMMRTKDVYAAGNHTLRIYPQVSDGVGGAFRNPTGIVEIMTTAFYQKA